MDLKLRVTQGKNVGQEVPVPGKKFLIGRAEDCNLRPGSDLISRHHCVIIIDDGYLAVRDFGSKNGTYVNGERVVGECEIKHGDHLRVGPLEFDVNVSQGGLGGKKKPPVHDPKEAAQRTAATPLADEQDVTRWLSEPAPRSAAPSTQDTQQVRIGDTDEIDVGSTRELCVPASLAANLAAASQPAANPDAVNPHAVTSPTAEPAAGSGPGAAATPARPQAAVMPARPEALTPARPEAAVMPARPEAAVMPARRGRRCLRLAARGRRGPRPEAAVVLARPEPEAAASPRARLPPSPLPVRRLRRSTSPQQAAAPHAAAPPAAAHKRQ